MKILITGADGFLGKKLLSFLSQQRKVFGISRRASRKNVFLLDLSDKERLESTIIRIKPSVIVHAASLVDVEKCETEKELAYKMNVECTENIIALCKKYIIKLIYISTDYVFSGKEKVYALQSKKDPISYYGETKSVAEERIRTELSDFAIIRPTILYGFNDFQDKKNFVLNIIDKIQNGENVVLDSKRIKYPILIDDVAQAVERIIVQNKKGIFHLSGTDRVTKEEWGKRVARIFNLPEEKISGKNFNELYRPQEVTFDVKESIIKVLNLEDGLKLVKKQMETK